MQANETHSASVRTVCSSAVFRRCVVNIPYLHTSLTWMVHISGSGNRTHFIQATVLLFPFCLGRTHERVPRSAWTAARLELIATHCSHQESFEKHFGEFWFDNKLGRTPAAFSLDKHLLKSACVLQKATWSKYRRWVYHSTTVAASSTSESYGSDHQCGLVPCMNARTDQKMLHPEVENMRNAHSHYPGKCGLQNNNNKMLLQATETVHMVTQVYTKSAITSPTGLHCLRPENHPSVDSWWKLHAQMCVPKQSVLQPLQHETCCSHFQYLVVDLGSINKLEQ